MLLFSVFNYVLVVLSQLSRMWIKMNLVDASLFDAMRVLAETATLGEQLFRLVSIQLPRMR